MHSSTTRWIIGSSGLVVLAYDAVQVPLILAQLTVKNPMVLDQTPFVQEMPVDISVSYTLPEPDYSSDVGRLSWHSSTSSSS
jgi:hypothetical protein